MTQSQTQNQNLTEGLNRIRRWRDQYRSMQPPSPLEDVNQLAAKLEMTHAHPSGNSNGISSSMHFAVPS